MRATHRAEPCRHARSRNTASQGTAVTASAGPGTITVARVGLSNDKRVSYAEASRVLLRDSILDGMREMLLTRDWSAITLSDVAKAAGISRQTIYNEFGSRQGLAQGYAMRLADRLVDQIHGAINGNAGDVYAAFLQGFRDFFVESAADPLVISLLTGTSKPDLLQLITTDSAPIINHCSSRLTESFMSSWVRCSQEDAGVLARAIVRLAMSYISMPPEADHDVARDLARLMTPFAERYGVIDP
ncbi:TetR family transcriptional regulator [Mycolicibacterium austroafricanum]|uniref:TetR family transcriptional regulator n=1 Tax=Mycolicibacterium austroafricanum TaxID=39687 RepID=B6UKY9_MYCAO|nr:TetR family transcriptional regulator [Mycolicibacterium austroafricanum]